LNTGSCQCRQVEFKINSKPKSACYCYCSICRRLTGSEKGAYASVEKDAFTWLKGEEKLVRFNQNENLVRAFCSGCGSFLVSVHRLVPNLIFISLGAMDSELELEIEYQQFVASKANWSNVDPNIKQYDEWPPWFSVESKGG